MFSRTQPPPARTAAEAGLPEHISSLLASAAGYLRARLELAGIEGREAAASYGKAVAFLAATVGLLLFGYILLWIGVIALVAYFAGVHWGWITLAIGILHVIGAACCALAAKAKWGRPVFPATLQELRKDQEWLSSPKQTANRN